MPAVDVSSMTDRYQFSAAARSRAWDWLFALRKRLNVDLQLVDDAYAPLLGGSGGPSVDSLLAGEAANVKLAVSTAIRTRTPQAATADRVQAVIVPVTLDREVSGALIVARRIAENQSLDDARNQLELVGFWLTNAVEAHLQSPPAAQGDLDRLSLASHGRALEQQRFALRRHVVGHRRLDNAGVDGIDANALLGVFRRGGLGEEAHSALG